MCKTQRFCALAALVLAGPITARADIILDSFVERTGAAWPNTTTVTDPTLPTNTETSLSTVLGNRRDSAVGQSTMSVSGFDSATADIYNQNGYSFLDYRSSVGAAATVELGYGAGTSLNLPGINSLAISFLGYDAANAGPLHVEATLYHGASSQQYGVDLTLAGAQNLVLPITGYPAQSVDRIVLDFVAPKGTDFRIDTISVSVPEPASLALAAVPAFALLLLRRR